MKEKNNISYKHLSFLSRLLNRVFCPECKNKMKISYNVENCSWNCLNCGHVVIQIKKVKKNV